jgi:hypothetical protein
MIQLVTPHARQHGHARRKPVAIFFVFLEKNDHSHHQQQKQQYHSPTPP